jgi:beta-xylosidase
VLRAGGLYYLYCTSGRAPHAFPIRVSPDLLRWEFAGSIFPAGERPGWARNDFWAPEVHRIGRRYVAYYTARDATRRLCIGAACADTPLGPWTDLGRPLLRDDRVGMIDSHCFEDRDGRRYLYWKADGNDLRPKERTPIYVQELGGDGQSLSGPRRAVLENDRDWEGDLVEGPWVVRRGRYYYLFYSGNAFWNEHYAVGVARSTSPFGPFVKREETVVRRDENWLGPGHGSVVRARDGHDYYVYHAWQRGRVGGKNPRLLLMDRIHWEDGWPRINDGSPSALPQAAPGGW